MHLSEKKILPFCKKKKKKRG